MVLGHYTAVPQQDAKYIAASLLKKGMGPENSLKPLQDIYKAYLINSTTNSD